MLKATASAIAEAFAAIEARDAVLGLALLLLAAGFWMIWSPLALIVPGAILALVAIYGAPGANDDAGE